MNKNIECCFMSGNIQCEDRAEYLTKEEGEPHIEVGACGNHLTSILDTEKIYAVWYIGNNQLNESPQNVYNMATQSLPPDEFVELERILIMLCETRGLELKIHEQIET